MKNSINQFDSTNSITIENPTPQKITEAVRQLGASEETIRRVSTSFNFIKYEDEIVVSRSGNKFRIGNSEITEFSGVTILTEGTMGKFAQLLAMKVAPSDASYAQAA